MLIAPAPELLAHRWFFALKPDDITARQTHVFAEEELGAKGLLRWDHHHVTLGLTEDFPDVPSELTDALLLAGDAVMATPFNLILDRLVGTNKSVALRPTGLVRPLRALQASIATAMAQQGIAPRPGWTFSPHETLCYRKGTPFIQPVTGFRWAVSEFVLVHSFIGLSRHQTIGRWPLHPPDDPQGTLF